MDFYNDDAAEQMYEWINDSLYIIDTDYIWLDSTEAAQFGQINYTLNNGALSGNYYVNTYSLFDTKWMYKLYENDYPERDILHWQDHNLQVNMFMVRQFGAVIVIQIGINFEGKYQRVLTT